MASDNESFSAPSAALSEGCGEDFFAESPEPGQLRNRSGGRQGHPVATPDNGRVGVWLISEDPSHAAVSSTDAGSGPVVSWNRQAEGVALIGWRVELEEALPDDNPDYVDSSTFRSKRLKDKSKKKDRVLIVITEPDEEVSDM